MVFCTSNILWYHKHHFLTIPLNKNNNNNSELIECFWKIKVLYNLKKNIQCTNTHNYANQWYTSIQNIQKLTNISIQSMAKTHAHKITHMCELSHTHTHTHTHTRTHTHTHTWSRAHTMPIKNTRTCIHSYSWEGRVGWWTSLKARARRAVIRSKRESSRLVQQKSYC